MVDTFDVQPKRGDAYKTTNFRKTLGNLFTDGYLSGQVNNFDIDNSFGNLTFKVKTGVAVIGGIYVELTALSDSKSIPASSTRQVFISLTLNASLRVTGSQIEILNGTFPSTPYIQIAELVSNATIITTVTQSMRITPKLAFTLGETGDSVYPLSTVLGDYFAPTALASSSDSGAVPATDFSDDWASYANQAAADAVWPTNATSHQSDVTNDELDFTLSDGGVNAAGCSHDFGAGVISDNAFVLRFKMRVDAFVNYSSGGAAHQTVFVLSSVNHTQRTGDSPWDALGFSFNTNPTKWRTVLTDNAAVGGTTAFLRAVAVETLYVQIRRVGLTTLKVALYSDSAFTNLLEEITDTIPATITGLRYFVVAEYSNSGYVSGSGSISGAIDDLKFYNSVPDVSLYRKTNSENNPYIYYDFGSDRDHAALCLMVDTVNTTETQIKIRASADLTFIDSETIRTINKSDFTNKTTRFILINRLPSNMRYIQIYGVSNSVVLAMWLTYSRYGLSEAALLRANYHRPINKLIINTNVDSN